MPSHAYLFSLASFGFKPAWVPQEPMAGPEDAEASARQLMAAIKRATELLRKTVKDHLRSFYQLVATLEGLRRCNRP